MELWTDGACSGNPGPGGWAAILRRGDAERVLTGADPDTTNNRMELMGVVEGLRALKRPVHVIVHTDSAYISRAMTEGWVERWQANGWRTSAKQPVLNRDLWEALIELAKPHRVEFVRVAGHAGVEMNERVDVLAVAAREALTRA